jgi:hypothetical protein
VYKSERAALSFIFILFLFLFDEKRPPNGWSFIIEYKEKKERKKILMDNIHKN